MDVLDAIGGARSMRWLRSDPVPDEMVDKLVWAASRASSAQSDWRAHHPARAPRH